MNVEEKLKKEWDQSIFAMELMQEFQGTVIKKLKDRVSLLQKQQEEELEAEKLIHSKGYVKNTTNKKILINSIVKDLPIVIDRFMKKSKIDPREFESIDFKTLYEDEILVDVTEEEMQKEIKQNKTNNQEKEIYQKNPKEVKRITEGISLGAILADINSLDFDKESSEIKNMIEKQALENGFLDFDEKTYSNLYGEIGKPGAVADKVCEILGKQKTVKKEEQKTEKMIAKKTTKKPVKKTARKPKKTVKKTTKKTKSK
ncbi:MAG TPA: hypothetical protein VMV95_03265 [Bacillota bacterium]|nr:hypothetical protein [Bacillota bacterium]